MNKLLLKIFVGFPLLLFFIYLFFAQLQNLDSTVDGIAARRMAEAAEKKRKADAAVLKMREERSK